MALKDWKKSSKYNSVNHTIFINKKSEYAPFKNNWDITVVRPATVYGMRNERFHVIVTKAGMAKEARQKFLTRSEALSFAKKYMRAH